MASFDGTWKLDDIVEMSRGVKPSQTFTTTTPPRDMFAGIFLHNCYGRIHSPSRSVSFDAAEWYSVLLSDGHGDGWSGLVFKVIVPAPFGGVASSLVATLMGGGKPSAGRSR